MDLSPGPLFTALIVSAIGFALWRHGRKYRRFPQLLGGIALMVYPYFVWGMAWSIAIACTLLAGIWLAVRAGF